MLGPMGAQVISLLKLITPAEIDRYVRKSKGRPIKALAAGGEDFDLAHSEPSPYKQSRTRPNGAEQNEAKILRLAPLARDDLTDEEREERILRPNARGRASPSGEGREAARDSTSAFLLEQRRRLKRSSARLAGSEAIKSYARNAGSEVAARDWEPEDFGRDPPDGLRGILINKRHS